MKKIQLCDYGCGQEAKYPPKKGMKKWCCSESYNSCSAIKKKNTGKFEKGNVSPMFGKTHSEESKKKNSDSHKGEKNHMFGKTVSKEIRKKMSESSKGRNRGRIVSKETRRKLRLAYIKDMENKYGQLFPNYNLEGCKLIDEYGKKHGYNFQHAENGGEYHIEELGYWIDGYDKEKNVVIEIDESFHFDIDGSLSEKDINRQKEIEEFLKCEFIRIRI